jgi:hypothetical protein
VLPDQLQTLTGAYLVALLRSLAYGSVHGLTSTHDTAVRILFKVAFDLASTLELVKG